tara:strand:- start:180 stop:404 length:225 start_codon:yes stop_codon:yes gene_type:complete
MFKLSDLIILVAVAISFALSVCFWFMGNYIVSQFTAIWVPSILCFAIYFKLLALSEKIKICLLDESNDEPSSNK